MKIEDQVDLNTFSEDTRNTLVRRAIKNATNELSDTVLKNLKELILSEIEYKELTLKKVSNFLKRIYMWAEEHDEIFNKKEGMVSQFLYDGREMGSIVDTENRSRMRPLVVAAINNAKRITLTALALEDKDNILSALKEALDKKGSRSKIITPIMTPEERTALRKIISLLEGMSDEDIKEAKKITFEGLTKLENSLVNISVMPAKAREEYYDYWRGIEDKFKKFTEVLGAISLIETEMADAWGGNFRMKGDEHKKDDKDSYDTEIELLLGEALLPSYIIECTPITIKDADDNKVALRLVEDYLGLIGKEIPLKFIDIKEQVTEQQRSSIREDYDAEGDGSSTSFDPTIGDELTDDIEEQLERAEALSKEKEVDPIFAILINNNYISGEYDTNILNIAREEIRNKLNYEDLGVLQQEIENVVNEDIDDFLNKYEQTLRLTESSDTFYFPCMDSNDIVSFFNRTKGTYKVSYLVKGEGEKRVAHRTRDFNKYSEAVDFINENTIKFFSRLAKAVELEHGIAALPTGPVIPRGYNVKGGKNPTPRTRLGGVTAATPTKLPTVNPKLMKEMKPLMKLVEEYHIKPLTGNKILLEDVPEFYSSKAFRDFPLLLTSSNVNQARKAMTMGATPVVSEKHYEDLNKFLKFIKYPDSINYSDTVKERFEKGLNAYNNFWAHADSIVDNDKILPQITSDAEIVFGNSLYEIAMATLTPKEVEEIDFEDSPLPFWNKKMKKENPSIETLLVLIESDEWQTFVENSFGIKRQNDILIYNLKETDMKLTGDLTHAILNASDMIRKMNGKSVYYANLDISDTDDISYVIDLIEKEDNIDIYGIDIYNILKSQSSFNDIADKNSLSSEIIYKIKGLFR